MPDLNLAAALACAAMIMGEPVPKTLMTVFEEERPRACTEEVRKQGKICLAWTRSSRNIWIVYGPRVMSWDTQVHEACHRVQYVREGGYNKRSAGRAAERECEIVAKRSSVCRRELHAANVFQ